MPRIENLVESLTMKRLGTNTQLETQLPAISAAPAEGP